MNERHYGALQGLNKAETAEKYGENQVLIWRRSYDTPPPPLDKTDPRHPSNDHQYNSIDRKDLPAAECLKDTVNRFLPYWKTTITPVVQSGKKALIVAHGNSLRALVKYLDQIPDEEIVRLNIPTGVPLIYHLDEHLKPIQHFYLGDPKKIQKAIHSVASQGKVKQ